MVSFTHHTTTSGGMNKMISKYTMVSISLSLISIIFTRY